MLEAMTRAAVGDDVFGLDPTVNALQDKAADLFGMEAALFCPSGTMTNQIAINIHTRPGDEVICHSLAHIYLYEGGGLMANSGVSVKLLGTPDGLMRPEDIAPAINNPDDPHAARSRLVALENTSNKGGGSCYDFATVKAIGDVASEKGLGYHLDGARIFNALVKSGDSPRQYGASFDSISVCLSKGLGCPVGSLLLGERDFIREAVRIRKRFGGGWRQAGYLAAAGIYALDNHIERLREDHARAARLGECLEAQTWVSSVNPVETNIVIFRTVHDDQALQIAEALLKKNVRISHLGQNVLRMVTHLDVSDTQIDQVCDIVSDLPAPG
jgi:threonine aldolase